MFAALKAWVRDQRWPRSTLNVRHVGWHGSCGTGDVKGRSQLSNTDVAFVAAVCLHIMSKVV